MSWKIYLYTYSLFFAGPSEVQRAFLIIPFSSISLATVFTLFIIVGFTCHPQTAVKITPQHKVTKSAVRANFSVFIHIRSKLWLLKSWLKLFLNMFLSYPFFKLCGVPSTHFHRPSISLSVRPIQVSLACAEMKIFHWVKKSLIH